MVETVVIVVAIVVAALLINAARKPDRFRVERSIVIAAPPDRIYPLVADLKTFRTWSPWSRKDPGMTVKDIGPASGLGAAYEWSGNKEVGEGRMEIVEADPSRRLGIRLTFRKPFRSVSETEFLFRPTAEGTTVVWSIVGPMPYVMRLLSIMNMDKMLGPDFERGLADLKLLAER